jgi:hypothetical protein
MIKFYVDMIKAKILTMDNVPENRKAEVQALLGE